MEPYYAWFLWMTRQKRTKIIPYPTYCSMKLFFFFFFFNKRSGAVVMSPDSEGLHAAVVAGVGPGSATITNRSPSHQEEEETE